MEYAVEELVPLVGRLAEKYTAGESTSIPYERAEQLMEAVCYCIREFEQYRLTTLAPADAVPAQKAYDIGVVCVREKAKEALRQYNACLENFNGYHNRCLQDTFVKGMPEFFRWYDVQFEPQNTILTLDYPVLRDLSDCTGIDKIQEYLRCICLEQKFLRRFPEQQVRSMLSGYDEQYEEMIDNLCEAVLLSVLGHSLAGKPFTEAAFTEEEYRLLKRILTRTERETLTKQLEAAVKTIVRQYYEDDEELLSYLLHAVGDIVFRLSNAAKQGALESLLA